MLKSKPLGRRGAAAGRRGKMVGGATHVGSEDVVGDGRLVDGRVLVGLEVDEGIVRDAFGGSRSCRMDC